MSANAARLPGRSAITIVAPENWLDGCRTRMHVVRLAVRTSAGYGKPTPRTSISATSGIMQRWDAGYAHTKAVLGRSPWVGEFDPSRELFFTSEGGSHVGSAAEYWRCRCDHSSEMLCMGTERKPIAMLGKKLSYKGRRCWKNCTAHVAVNVVRGGRHEISYCAHPTALVVVRFRLGLAAQNMRRGSGGNDAGMGHTITSRMP